MNEDNHRYMLSHREDTDETHIRLPEEGLHRPQARIKTIEAIPGDVDMATMRAQLQNVLAAMPFDSLSKLGYLFKLADEDFTLDKNGLLLAYQSLYRESRHRMELEKLECVGMSIELQTRLKSIGIKSHLIPATSPELGLMNKNAHDMIPIGHILLVYYSSESLFIMDPGAIIPSPLPLRLNDHTSTTVGDRTYVTYPAASKLGIYTHKLVVLKYAENKNVTLDGKVYSNRKYHFGYSFNPLKQILNPFQVVSLDIYRGYRNVRLAKQDENGKKHAYLVLDLLSGDLSMGLYGDYALKYNGKSNYQGRTTIKSLLNDRELCEILASAFAIELDLHQALERIDRGREAYLDSIIFPSVINMME